MTAPITKPEQELELKDLINPEVSLANLTRTYQGAVTHHEKAIEQRSR